MTTKPNNHDGTKVADDDIEPFNLTARILRHEGCRTLGELRAKLAKDADRAQTQTGLATPKRPEAK